MSKTQYSNETKELMKEAHTLPIDLECKLIINLAKMVIAENGNHDIKFVAVKPNGREA